MQAPVRRRPILRAVRKKLALNLQTLEMMVQSGVVRRADFDPPPTVSLKQFQVADEADRDSLRGTASAQGWLARVILGRKALALASRRS
ncbi:MAG: hypothetical protein NDI90_14000 [Nitrospira sp. BO4]|jgi:hypothetical protein|nr:hypothetical protein [Nitrospira sp. BO4]